MLKKIKDINPFYAMLISMACTIVVTIILIAFPIDPTTARSFCVILLAISGISAIIFGAWWANTKSIIAIANTVSTRVIERMHPHYSLLLKQCIAVRIETVQIIFESLVAAHNGGNPVKFQELGKRIGASCIKNETLQSLKSSIVKSRQPQDCIIHQWLYEINTTTGWGEFKVTSSKQQFHGHIHVLSFFSCPTHTEATNFLIGYLEVILAELLGVKIVINKVHSSSTVFCILEYKPQ